MNISYNWLKEYVKFDMTPEEVSAALTSIGLETDGVEEVQTIKGGLEGLVIGEVLTCVDHPDSDHLHITTVNLGDGVPVQIVCGAPNVAAGQKVVVATIGTKLYSGDECFTIKKGKIRGVESFGMICAEALKCGAAVAGSDTGGIPEVIGHENTVPLDDDFVSNMALKAVEMLKNGSEQQVPETLDWKTTAALEMNYVKSMISR